jgi:hypothetical protein
LLQVYILVTHSRIECKRKRTKKTNPLEKKRRRHQRLKERMSGLGLILQGTISRRKILRDDPKRPDARKEYGPYYQWTFKREGKTVTVNLTSEQAKAYQKAIDNQRKMEKLLRRMRTLSLQILEETTRGVKKRKT